VGEYEDGSLLPLIIRVIALMMETANTSETFVNFNQITRRYNTEHSHLPATYDIHGVSRPVSTTLFKCL
jgi:hypothetical protein